MTELPSPAHLDPAPRAAWAVRWRIGRLLLHLAAGLLLVGGAFPLLGPAPRQRLKAAWARRLLGIMGIELRVVGTVPDGGLLVANHISWLDIFVISAARPTAFVAKAEIGKWPLLGWLAGQVDTLFIVRGSRHHAQHIAHEMTARLQAGHSVAVFPEGTTSDGHQVMPFHAALLQPAISAAHPVQPLAIRYLGHNGDYTETPAYIGEISLGDSLRRTLAQRGIVAELVVLPALSGSAATGRRQLAQAAENAIRQVVAPGP